MIKKLILFSIFTFSISFIFAQKTDTLTTTGGYARITALGSSPFIIDPFLIVENPAWGAKYSNLLFGDIGSTRTPFGNDGNGQFAAANFRVSDNLTLGGILARNDFNAFAISTPDPLRKFNNGIVDQINSRVNSPLAEIENNLELFSTYKFGQTFIGLGVAFVGSNTESKPATSGRTKGDVSQFGVNIGVVTKIKNGHIIDVSASGTWPSATSDPPGGQPTTYDQTIYTLKARMFLHATTELDFVPVLGLFTAGGEAKIGDGSAIISTDLVNFKIITFGLGINYRYDNFLITGGPGMKYTIVEIPAVAGLEPKLTNTYFDLPVWNLGVEWFAADWFIARLGYTAQTSKEILESTASVNSKNENINTQFQPGEVRAGVGFRVGRFSLDATVNSDILRQGLNNIGGGTGTFAYLSSSFWFGKK